MRDRGWQALRHLLIAGDGALPEVRAAAVEVRFGQGAHIGGGPLAGGVAAKVDVAEFLLGELACVGEGQMSRVVELEVPDTRRALGAIAERVGVLAAEAHATEKPGTAPGESPQ